MKASSANRRIWAEIAVLAGLSGLTAWLLNRVFARYQPFEGPPAEKPGDTPAAPWQMPKPEEKAKAEPVRQALDRATARIDTPEKADQVAEKLEEMTGGITNGEIEQARKPEVPVTGSEKVEESSQRIQKAANTASNPSTAPEEKAANGIAQAAIEVSANRGKEREALAEATQETLNPEQQGAPGAANPKQRRYLRQAMLKRMNPLDALDAELFLAVNHLPHNRWLNGFFYFFTFTFTAGLGWYAVLASLALFGKPHKSLLAGRHIILPLTIATAIVEYPFKAFFRRRRPFISVIQAIVIGKKPGSWSFPSGHSAGAFAGAWLLSQDFPRQRLLFYPIAALVAFSRIYLGDHYPGDVLSGSLSGIALADIVSRGQHAVLKD